MSEVEKVETSSSDPWILDRISSLPVMATALDQLNSLYAKAKDTRFVGATMNVTEAGIGLAYNATKPVAEKFEKQIDFLNKAACNQLNKLEETFPIITKPTEEVVKATLDYGHQIVDPVVGKVTSVRDYGAEKVNGVTEQATKTLALGGHMISDATNFTVGVTLGTANKVAEVVAATGSYGATKVAEAKNYGVEKVTEVKNYGVEKVTEVKNYGVEKVTEVKNYGVEKVTEVKQKVVSAVSQGTDSLEGVKKCLVGRIGETSGNVGEMMQSIVDDKLVTYETYLDYFLPPGEEERVIKADDKSGLAHKIYLVSDKTRNRVNRKLMREIRSTCQKCESFKEASMTQLENSKTYIFAFPEKLSSGVSFVKDSANAAASSASYEAMSALSALVASANGMKDKAEGVYKHVQEGVNLSADFEKLLVSGKEFGLQFVHDIKGGSEKVISYAIHLPKHKFECAKDKVLFLWTEINRPEEEVLEEVLGDGSANQMPESSTFERKLIATSRHLLQKTKDIASPVAGLVQVTKKQVEEVVHLLTNNLPEMNTENVINTSYLQVSILKPDFLKLFSDTYASSVDLLKKLNIAILDLTVNRFKVRNLEGAAAEAIEEIPLVEVEQEANQSHPIPIGNHEEIRNIDDVTTEEEDDEVQDEEEEKEDVEKEGEKKDDDDDDDDEEDDDEEDDEEDDDITESPSK